MWYAALAQISENEHDHDHGKNQTLQKLDGKSVTPEFQHENHRSQNLNRGIEQGNAAAAITATPAQKDVTEDRNIVVPADAVAAAWAVRSGADNRLATRHADNADVEEAAENQPEQCHNCLDHPMTLIQCQAAGYGDFRFSSRL